MQRESFELRYYKQLIGKVVESVHFAETDFCVAFPVLVFKDGTFAQVSRDPGGNGPGHLFICNADGSDMLPPEKK